MAKALTTKSVENIKSGATRLEIPDGGCRGLYLVVHPEPSDRRSWAVRYRFRGKSKKLTLDGPLTLAAARKKATEALHEIEHGRDPAVLKSETRAAQEKIAGERAVNTVDVWAVHFIERHCKRKTRPNTLRQTVHVFDNIVLPAWRGRIVHDIVRRDVIDLVEGVAEDRPIMANRTLAVLSKFFSWLCERDIVTASPCTGVRRPSEERARDRFLSEDEIKRLWAACDAIGGTAAPYVKLLLLTGARPSELAGMRRSAIKEGVWSLAPEEVKNKRRHDVPLSTQALTIIDAMPRIAGDYVFTSSASRRLDAARIKAAIDKYMQPATPFVLHDLRRSAATHMARIGVRLPVIEKCLNHSSGSFRGIVAVYQRHDFLPEMKEAFQRLADHVDQIVAGKSTGKIIRGRFTRK